jgi:hypothetical protein
MAQYEGSYPRDAAQTGGMAEVNGWAVGFIFFASMLMVLIGSFHFIQGLVAIIDDTFYVVRPGYDLQLDVTAWGWVHMIGGIVLVIAGAGLMTGNVLARIVAIVLATLSVLGSFYSIPYYPVWSIMMIVLGIGVIWALTVHGNDLSPEA